MVRPGKRPGKSEGEGSLPSYHRIYGIRSKFI